MTAQAIQEHQTIVGKFENLLHLAALRAENIRPHPENGYQWQDGEEGDPFVEASKILEQNGRQLGVVIGTTLLIPKQGDLIELGTQHPKVLAMRGGDIHHDLRIDPQTHRPNFSVTALAELIEEDSG